MEADSVSSLANGLAAFGTCNELAAVAGVDRTDGDAHTGQNGVRSPRDHARDLDYERRGVIVRAPEQLRSVSTISAA